MFHCKFRAGVDLLAELMEAQRLSEDLGYTSTLPKQQPSYTGLMTRDMQSLLLFLQQGQTWTREEVTTLMTSYYPGRFPEEGLDMLGQDYIYLFNYTTFSFTVLW